MSLHRKLYCCFIVSVLCLVRLSNLWINWCNRCDDGYLTMCGLWSTNYEQCVLQHEFWVKYFRPVKQINTFLSTCFLLSSTHRTFGTLHHHYFVPFFNWLCGNIDRGSSKSEREKSTISIYVLNWREYIIGATMLLVMNASERRKGKIHRQHIDSTH